MTEYAEPVFPLTKTEKFDEDNCKELLKDEMFATQDRARLSNYNKHRISGGIMCVVYKLAEGCEEHKLGRLFPSDAIGLQSFRFDMRNSLAKKFYWDLDFENCHYRIAEKYCENYGLNHTYISKYIDNRDECLALVSDNRKKAKTEFLKILYGGNIKLYNETYDEVEGSVRNEGMEILTKIQKEITFLMNTIWEKHSHLHKLKCGSGKQKIPINKKSNPKASLMSLIFQTKERELLMYFDFLLGKWGRCLSVLIHDGGYVEKIDGETEIPSDILQECGKMITDKFAIRTTISQKAIEYSWSPQTKLSEYQQRKKEFEKRNFFVGSNLIYIQQDGTIENVKVNDMKNRQKNNNYMEYDIVAGKNVKKYFFDEWMSDKDRKNYEKVDFIPDKTKCPDYVFNLFRGFKVEELITEQILKEYQSKTQEEIMDLWINKIIKHIDYLTSGYSDYILKWLANIIQNPMNRSQVAIMIRDMGGLLEEGGGTGKNMFFDDWFGNEILGEDLVYVVGDNRELYGSFNSQFEGKLLVIVEEASGKENHSNIDILKSKITAKKMNINKKQVASYQVRDFTNLLFATNNRNPLPFKQGNRRLAAFETNPECRDNVDYFKELHKHLSTPIVKVAFYQFLKNLPTYSSPIDFQTNIPKTSVYKELRMLNAPIHIKWLADKVKKSELFNGSISQLYDDFVSWVKKTREGREEGIMTITAFGLMLNNNVEKKKLIEEEDNIYNDMNDYGDKSRTKKGMFMKWNVDAVVDGLKKLYMLDDDFVYDKSDFLDTTDNESVMTEDV
jgi:hypothetical protein